MRLPMASSTWHQSPWARGIESSLLVPQGAGRLSHTGTVRFIAWAGAGPPGAGRFAPGTMLLSTSLNETAALLSTLPL